MPRFLRHPTGKMVKLGGIRRDPPGHDDPKYSAAKFQSDELPAFVDLRPNMTAVEDQGELSSCTANALAGALEYLEKQITGQEVNISRLFVYWNERDLDGETDKDEGAVLRNGVKALQTQGACAETTWPYDPGTVFDRPHDGAYEEAAAHTIDEAHKVEVEAHDMRHCLADGYPFAFGMTIFKSFEKDGHHGRISMPLAGEKDEGGHAMLCVGYSDEDKVFLVRNSWGPKWGDQGYCYVPYDYLGNPEIAHDFWTIRKAHNLDFSQGVRGTPAPHGTRTSFFGSIVNAVSTTASVLSAAQALLNRFAPSPGQRVPVQPIRTQQSPAWSNNVSPPPPAEPNPWASDEGTLPGAPNAEPEPVANPWATDDNQPDPANAAAGGDDEPAVGDQGDADVAEADAQGEVAAADAEAAGDATDDNAADADANADADADDANADDADDADADDDPKA